MWHGSEKTVCHLIFCIIALITEYCLEVMNGSFVEKKRPVFRKTPKICSECTSPHNTQVVFIVVQRRLYANKHLTTTKTTTFVVTDFFLLTDTVKVSNGTKKVLTCLSYMICSTKSIYCCFKEPGNQFVDQKNQSITLHQKLF